MQLVEQNQLVKQPRLYAGDRNPHWKSDELFKRTCVECQNKQTHIDKENGRPIWYRNKEGYGFVCYNCYMKSFNKKRYSQQITRLSECECECGCKRLTSLFRGKPQRFVKGHGSRGSNNYNYGKHWKMSEDTKRKIGIANIGKNVGKTRSPETRAKLSVIRRLSNEHKAKIKTALSGKY
jgi:hypothetical protein